MRDKRGIPLITMGLLLITAALLLTGYNLLEDERAAQSVEQIIAQMGERHPAEPETGGSVGGDTTEEIPDYLLNPSMEMPEEIIDGHSYIGVLEIPAYGLTLPVMSQWSYPSLKIAPCRYMGSAYTDDLIIAAHNYTSHFGNLKNLEPGDRIIFTDVDGNVFSYEVILRETLMPTAIEEMESGDWDLTLFTCTIGGAYRVTVRCQRAE